MPAGVVDSPPWVSGAWLDTVWEDNTWGAPVSPSACLSASVEQITASAASTPVIALAAGAATNILRDGDLGICH